MTGKTIRILGIDPGLQRCGWGVIDYTDNVLTFVAGGCIKPPVKADMARRLGMIDVELEKIIAQWKPDEAAIEETFSNTNAASTLKLGMARGAAFIAPARAGLTVGEYAATTVKKSVVGAGHADKAQVQMMVKVLLPKASFEIADTADALAVAICHAHHR